MFPVLGKALLGIAGAYVLRALEESSSLPKLAVASAGIAYAFLWLAGAARTRSRAQFAGTIYACTSALILAPMLWELTLRFALLPPAISAGVLCAFALAAVAMAWKHDLAPLLRVALIAAAGLALALAVASHALMPFVLLLLALTAINEFVPPLARLPEVRAVVALAADAAVWILIYVYFSPQNAREDYPALGKAALLAPGIVLFLLFSASIVYRTVPLAKRITAFETAQASIAFLLAAVSLADFGPAGNLTMLGVTCLLLACASYTAVFTVFESRAERRNASVFAAWSAVLLVAGSFLCLPSLALILLLVLCAVGAIILGRYRSTHAFEFYGLVFLIAAVAASGLPGFAAAVWIGTPPGTPPMGLWFAIPGSILCYAAVKPVDEKMRWAQALRFAFAALAAGAAVTLLAQLLFAAIALKVIPGAHHLALIRTLMLCVATLALASGGARWRRSELTRLGYAAMGMVAIKLVFEDLRHGHLAYIAASIFLVALTLIAAPRVARSRQMDRQSG